MPNETVAKYKGFCINRKVNGHVYFSARGSKGVVIYIYKPEDPQQFIIRFEPSGFAEDAMALIGGAVEDNETPYDAALRELKEEIGYGCKEEDLVSLGSVYLNKYTDIEYYLFALDYSKKFCADCNYLKTAIEELDKRDETYWYWLSGDPKLDPLAFVCYYRLLNPESRK